jgi:serralysin
MLWQNASGQAAIWTMDGMNLTGGATVGPNPGRSWHAEDAADFNGDGKADILWQSDSGQAAIWTMDGTTLTGAAVQPNPGSDWHLV